MTDKDRLITKIMSLNKPTISLQTAMDIVDAIIDEGVIVLPCKVGDKTFLLLEKTSGGYDIVESECVCIVEKKYSKVYSMAIDCVEIGNTLEFYLDDFGRWVFLTKEEAEQALRERGRG